MNLEKKRDEIDKIDKEIFKLFQNRMEIVGQIALVKIQNNCPIEDKEREKKILKDKIDLIQKNDIKIDSKYYVRLFENLMEVSKDYQKEIMESKELD